MAIAHHTVVGISAIKSSLLVSLAKMRVCRLLVKSWSNLIEEFPLSSDCLYTHTHTSACASVLSLTLLPVGLDNTRHELLLTVLPHLVPHQDLILCQAPLQV